MSVLLPAPFEPINAWISPSAMERSMASLATRPPNRLVTALSSRIGSSILRFMHEETIESARGRQHRKQQQWSEHKHPVLGVERDHFLQQYEDGAAEHRADEAAYSAEDQDDEKIA